jgi:hypothetical protein
MPDAKNIKITSQMLAQIAELDEFKGAWTGFTSLRTEQLKHGTTKGAWYGRAS